MGLKLQQSVVFFSPSIAAGEKFQALIEGMTPEGLALSVPWGDLEIKEGWDITISFWDEHATYEFVSKVLRTKQVSETTLLVSKPNSLVKIINRSYNRVQVNIKSEVGLCEELKKEPALLVDISAGGAFLQGQSRFNANDLVKLTFQLPDGERFEDIVAKVAWKKEVGGGLANYGLQFENLSTIRKQKLLHFTEPNRTS
jgi:c-di-GMP-binding flagellar brake protein YcgR